MFATLGVDRLIPPLSMPRPLTRALDLAHRQHVVRVYVCAPSFDTKVDAVLHSLYLVTRVVDGRLADTFPVRSLSEKGLLEVGKRVEAFASLLERKLPSVILPKDAIHAIGAPALPTARKAVHSCLVLTTHELLEDIRSWCTYDLASMTTYLKPPSVPEIEQFLVGRR